MSSSITTDLFVEDRAHEEFLKAALTRLARQEGRTLDLRVRSARGGHGRALREFVLYQQSVMRISPMGGLPDLLCVAIDANCQRFGQARQQVHEKLETPFRERAIVACPDPHIERWYLADPDSFAEVVGVQPKVGRRKCERDRYKAILSKAIMEAGHPPTLGGIEFAREIVEGMDFYRAGKAERSLKHFLEEATARLRTFAG
jgi:hypothetical protein